MTEETQEEYEYSKEAELQATINQLNYEVKKLSKKLYQTLEELKADIKTLRHEVAFLQKENENRKVSLNKIMVNLNKFFHNGEKYLTN